MYNNYTWNQTPGWGATGYVMAQGQQPAVPTQQFVQNPGTLRGSGMTSQIQLQQQYLQQQQTTPTFSSYLNQLEMQQQQQAYLQQQQNLQQSSVSLPQQLAFQAQNYTTTASQWSQINQQLTGRPQQPPLPVEPHPDVIQEQKIKIQRQQEQLRQLWNSNKQQDHGSAAAAQQQQPPPTQNPPPPSSAPTFSTAEIENTVNKILPFINDIFNKVGAAPGKGQIPGLGDLSQQLANASNKDTNASSSTGAKPLSTSIPSRESNQNKKQQQVPVSSAQTQKPSQQQKQETSSWQALKESQERAKLLASQNQNGTQQQQTALSSSLVQSEDVEIIEVKQAIVEKSTAADNSNKNEVTGIPVSSSAPTSKEMEKRIEQIQAEVPPTTTIVENKNIDVSVSSATASTLFTTTTTVISTEILNKTNDHNKESQQQNSETSVPPASSVFTTTTTNAIIDTNVNSSKEESSSQSSGVPPHTTTAQANQTYDAKTLAAFDEKFKNWEKQFEDWKASNAKHPDKATYTKYLDQWTHWRVKLEDQRKFIIDKINDSKDEPLKQQQQGQIMTSMNNGPGMASNNFLRNNSNFNTSNNNFGPNSTGPRTALLSTPTMGLAGTSVPFDRYNESQAASVRVINTNNNMRGPNIGNINSVGRGPMNQQRLPPPLSSSFLDKTNPFVTPSSGFGFGPSGPSFGRPRMSGGFGLNSSFGPRMSGPPPVRIPRVKMFDGDPVPRLRPPGGFMSGGFNDYDDDEGVGDEAKYADRFANEDRESPPPPVKQRNGMNPFDNFDRNPSAMSGSYIDDDAGFEKQSRDNPWMRGNQIRGPNPFDMMDQPRQKLQPRNPLDAVDTFQNETLSSDACNSQRGRFASHQQQQLQQARDRSELDAAEEEHFEDLFLRGRPSRSHAPISTGSSLRSGGESVARRDDFFEQAVIDYGHGSGSNDADDIGPFRGRGAVRQEKKNIPYGEFGAQDDGDAVTIDYGHGATDIPSHPNDYYDEHKKPEDRSFERGLDESEDDYRIRPKPYREEIVDKIEGPGNDYDFPMPPHHHSVVRMPYYGAGDRGPPPGPRGLPYYGPGERGHPCGPGSMQPPRMPFGGRGKPLFPSVAADPAAFRSMRVAPKLKGALSVAEDEPDIIVLSPEPVTSKGVKVAPPRDDWSKRFDWSRDRSPDRRERDRSLGRRERDRSLDRRDRSPGRRERDRSPDRRERDRSPDRRERDRSPDRRERVRSPDRRAKDRSPDRRERDREHDRERDRLRRERDRERERDWKYSRGGRDSTPPRRSRINSEPFEVTRRGRNTSRSKSPALTNPPPPASSHSPSGGGIADRQQITQPQRAPPVLIEDILSVTGKKRRPSQIVIILRGLPGSGKSHLAKLIKDKEIELGGSAPRILSLDDYFMTEEVEKVVKDPVTGKDVKEIVMQYEYEPLAESTYRQDLVKAFKKTVENGYFPFIVVDSVNDCVRYFEDMAHYASLKRFQVYIAEVEETVDVCVKRNIHERTLFDISTLHKNWEATPPKYLRLDLGTLLHDEAVEDDVEMEDVDNFDAEARTHYNSDGAQVVTIDLAEGDEDDAYEHAPSKWEIIDQSEERLNKLDGLCFTKRKLEEAVDQVTSVETWLKRNLPEDYSARVVHENGKKRVRWADIEERRAQLKIKNLGFVVGQTDWSRMNDPTFGAAALTRTKFI